MSDGPWFPLYPERFLASKTVRRMTATQIGIYFGLLMDEWLEGGPLPDNPDDLALSGRAPIAEVMGVLSACFERTDDGSWANETLEEIRREQLQKLTLAKHAGKKGAEVRWGKRKHKAPQQENSHPIADPMGCPCDPIADPNRVPQCYPNGIRVEEKRVEESRVEKTEVGVEPPPDDAETEPDSIAPNELVAYWIDQQRDRPPTAAIGKQGAAAKRLCATYPRSSIVQAAVGIGQLFPHSNGEPWDLFDLERKFAKALEAAHSHPAAKVTARAKELASLNLEGPS